MHVISMGMGSVMKMMMNGNPSIEPKENFSMKKETKEKKKLELNYKLKQMLLVKISQKKIQLNMEKVLMKKMEVDSTKNQNKMLSYNNKLMLLKLI